MGKQRPAKPIVPNLKIITFPNKSQNRSDVKMLNGNQAKQRFPQLWCHYVFAYICDVMNVKSYAKIKGRVCRPNENLQHTRHDPPMTVALIGYLKRNVLENDQPRNAVGTFAEQQP